MSIQGYKNTTIGPTFTESQRKRLTSRTYRGFSTVNSDSKSPALYDLALIKQDIINHFHIRKGEKLENPNFGTIIWDVLFEPLTEQMKQIIVNDVTEIVNSDPRVNVVQTIVTQKDLALQIEITLIYLPYNIQESLQFSFDSANGLLR
jgi:phage baseplate assembly protein W